MHIPDGFLDLKTAVATGVLAVGALGVALRNARVHLPAKRVPLLGLTAAFVFAAQMLNFPVIAGTSGHLVGGVLTAVLLGPSAAVVVISAVLIVQCLLFNDGGLTTLGANILNMAVIGGAGGWVVYWGITRVFKGLFGKLLAASFAAWLSAVGAAVVCAGELASSRMVDWSTGLVTIGGIHMLIGLGEAAITALVLAFIAKSRPELWGGVEGGVPVERERVGAVVVFGLVIALGLAAFVGPYACGWPDGLDKSAEWLRFKSQEAGKPVLVAPMPDYAVPAISHGGLAKAIAGAVGTVVAFGMSCTLAWALVRKKQRGAREA